MSLKHILVRIAGIALLIAGVAGLVFCIAAIVLLGPLERKVEAAATEQLELVDEALTITADGLAVAGTSLSRATAAIGSLEGTLDGVGKAINGTAPVLESVAEFMGENLPATLETTQDTLRSVATSAKLVDDMLAIVTNIPLLNLKAYDPEVPLYEGFKEVADSLDSIPKSLSRAQDGLESTMGSMEEVEGDFATMATNVGKIATDLEDARSVIIQYQEIVSQVQGTISTARQSLPDWLHMVRWGLSLMLIWLGVAQIGLVTQGWELIERSRTNRAASTE
jgi:methyl-accepting chemotaxis protein